MVEEQDTGPNKSKLSEVEHWNKSWSKSPRHRLPSSLLVGTLNLKRLLRLHVKPGARFLEIGCAPGKMLVWVEKVLNAIVTGVDYSMPGIDVAQALFDALDAQGELICGDIFSHPFKPGTFDVVYSAGVIEHFDDPREIVRIHADLLKPGGKALITVPNFGGFYGKLLDYCDPDIHAIHNMRIMRPAALRQLVPEDLAGEVRAYPAGRVSIAMIRLDSRFPSLIAKAAFYGVNLLGILQPFDIPMLCPMLVLEFTRGGSPRER